MKNIMHKCLTGVRTRAVALGLVAGMSGPAAAFTLTLSSASFGLTSVFNELSSFSFEIQIDGPLAPGIYSNPALGGVTYSVQGVLGTITPSGFPGFNLQRTIAGGSAFYDQGSSLNFEIAPGADLSDGLQLSELAGAGPVFVFDGRELGTGRYHPPWLELFADGTGKIQNSNNLGGINPMSGQFVDVDFGEEYIVTLNTNPATLTLAVPEPASALLMGLGLAALFFGHRRLHGANVSARIAP